MSGKNSKIEIFCKSFAKNLCRAPGHALAPARCGHGHRQRHGNERRRLTLHVELLESRLTPVTIPLNPATDQFGDQIVTVQSYGDPYGASANHAAFSFFDSGASAITFSAAEQAALA